MKMGVSDDELAKVGIVGDEQTPFASGERKHLRIRETGPMISGHRGGIVTERAQVHRHPSIGTLVNEELHPLA